MPMNAADPLRLVPQMHKQPPLVEVVPEVGYAIRRRREIERCRNRDHRLHDSGKIRSRGKTESEGAAQGEADDGNAPVPYTGVDI